MKMDHLKCTHFIWIDVYSSCNTCLISYPPPKSELPYPKVSLLLYCSNSYSTGYIHTYTHIYRVKSQLISHTTWQRLYIEQGVLNAPKPMKVRFQWICYPMVHWNQMKDDKLRNLCPLHELFSPVFWRCIHLLHFPLLHINWLSSFLGLPLWYLQELYYYWKRQLSQI